MSRRKLSVVPGGQARTRKPKTTNPQDVLAARWRAVGAEATASKKLEGDVIPLLEGWIRRLERQVGLAPAANGR